MKIKNIKIDFSLKKFDKSTITTNKIFLFLSLLSFFYLAFLLLLKFFDVRVSSLYTILFDLIVPIFFVLIFLLVNKIFVLKLSLLNEFKLQKYCISLLYSTASINLPFIFLLKDQLYANLLPISMSIIILYFIYIRKYLTYYIASIFYLFYSIIIFFELYFSIIFSNNVDLLLYFRNLLLNLTIFVFFAVSILSKKFGIYGRPAINKIIFPINFGQLFVVLTFFLIVSFAWVYFFVARLTDGNAFSYNKENLFFQYQQNLAKKFPGLPSHFYRLLVNYLDNQKDLIVTEVHDYINNITTYHSSSDNNTSGIGFEWGMFYQQLFTNRGVIHFRIIKSKNVKEKKSHFYYDLLLYEKEHSTPKIIGEKYYVWYDHEPFDKIKYDKVFAEYKVSLPKYLPYSEKCDHPGVNIVNKKYFEPELCENLVFRIESLSIFLKFSENFLDKSIIAVKDIIDIKYLNTFFPYLRFSVSNILASDFNDFHAIDVNIQYMVFLQNILGYIFLAAIAFYLFSKN